MISTYSKLSKLYFLRISFINQFHVFQLVCTCFSHTSLIVFFYRLSFHAHSLVSFPLPLSLQIHSISLKILSFYQFSLLYLTVKRALCLFRSLFFLPILYSLITFCTTLLWFMCIHIMPLKAKSECQSSRIILL